MTRNKLFSWVAALCLAMGVQAEPAGIERPNVESLQRALQERYVLFLRAARAFEVANMDSVPDYLTFPVRVSDGKSPGHYPPDCFYEEDLVDPESGELNYARLLGLMADLGEKFYGLDGWFDPSAASGWGDQWILPAWGDDMVAGSAAHGDLRTVPSFIEYYPEGTLTLSRSNYEEVYRVMGRVLGQMRVMWFPAPTKTPVPLTKQGVSDAGESCEDVKTLTLQDFNAATAEPYPGPDPYSYELFQRKQLLYYEELSGDEVWHGKLVTVEGRWEYDLSSLRGYPGEVEIYGILKEAQTSTITGEAAAGVLAADGAPHTALEEWFSIATLPMGSGSLYQSDTYAPLSGTAFAVPCPTVPGAEGRSEFGWALMGRILVRPEFKHLPSEELATCTECGTCDATDGTCSKLEFGSIRYRMGLGRNAEGGAGSLFLREQMISTLSASPYGLKLQLEEGAGTVVRDATREDLLQQVIGENTLVDVEVVHPYREYKLRYFDGPAMGLQPNGTYQPDPQDAFKTITVSNPDDPGFEFTATADPSTPVVINTAEYVPFDVPGHGLDVGTAFFVHINTLSGARPEFVVNGSLSRKSNYAIYAFSEDELLLLFLTGAGYYDADPPVKFDPNATYTIQSVAPYGRLEITEENGGQTRVISYTSTSVDPRDEYVIQMEDDQGGRFRAHHTQREDHPTDPARFFVTTTESDHAGNAIRKTLEEYAVFPWNDPGHAVKGEQAEVVQRVEDPDGEALTTIYDYYDDAAADGAHYGYLKSVQYPDGSWEAYEYDADHRVEKVYRPFGDTPLSFQEAGNRVRAHTRGTVGDQDGDGEAESLATTISKLDGHEVERSYTLTFSDVSDGFQRQARIRTLTPGATWNDPDNLRTDRWTVFNGEFHGKSAREIRPDGTGTLWTYAVDSETGNRTTIERRGSLNANGDAVETGIETVTVTAPHGGRLSRTETDIETGIVLASDTTLPGEFDSRGRPLVVTHLDGTTTEWTYQDCCGTQTTVDRTGAERAVVSHPDGTLKSVETHGIREEVSEDYDTDASDGLTGFMRISERIGRGESTPVTIRREVRSPSGRLLAVVDPRDGVTRLTTYDRALVNGREEVTTILPDQSTRSAVRHRDGSLFEEKVNGQAVRRVVYGVETDTHDGHTFPARTTKTISVGDGGETTEWVKEWRDMAGRVYKVETPDPQGGAATFEALRFFDAAGRLRREVDADGKGTLYTYDERGRLRDTVEDLDADGVVDYDGTDRIVRKTHAVLADPEHGDVLRETSRVWETDQVDVSTEVARIDRAVTGLQTWASRYGHETHAVTSYPGNGIVVRTRTEGNGVVTVDTADHGFQTDRVVRNASDEVLQDIGYTPDPFDRILVATDRVAGTAWTYEYYDTDRLKKRIGPESAPGADDAQTTEYAYDEMGRLRTVTLPDGGVQTTDYDPEGRPSLRYGAEVYPVAYGYDRQGRLKTLTTWREFDTDNGVGLSGAATTTWRYNELGLVSEKAFSDLGTVNHVYTPGGRVDHTVSGRNHTTDYVYNPDSLDVVRTTYDDGVTATVEILERDRLGRVLRLADASGERTLEYEEGALVSEAYTSGALAGYRVERPLDALGRPDGVTVKEGGVTAHQVDYGYDGFSRLQTVTVGTRHVEYGYFPGAAVRQTRALYNGTTLVSTVGVERDAMDRLTAWETQVEGGRLWRTEYAYDALNRIDRADRPVEGDHWSYQYDALGQVEGAIHYATELEAYLGRTFSYGYDDAGNRVQTAHQGRVAAYVPTDLNQYTQRDIPRYLDVGGEADAAATVTVGGEAAARQGRYFYRELDRTSEGNGATLEEVTITATLPPAQGETAERIGEIEEEALLLAHPESFGYDGDGNLTHDGRWVYTWNAENRLITMETSTQALQAGVPRQKLAFTYDSQGRRVGKTVYAWNETVGYEVTEERLFLYDGWNLVHEIRNPGAPEETAISYVWGTDVSGSFQGAGGVGGLLMSLHEGDTAYAPVYEGGKNIVGYHDADTGETVAEFAYGPFGEPLRARVGVEAELPFRYSTKYTEAESGLLYYGYRFYDPETGRWLSRDPIGEEGGVNLYGFVGNDGVNGSDFLGLLDTKEVIRTGLNVKDCEKSILVVMGPRNGMIWWDLLSSQIKNAQMNVLNNCKIKIFLDEDPFTTEVIAARAKYSGFDAVFFLAKSGGVGPDREKSKEAGRMMYKDQRYSLLKEGGGQEMVTLTEALTNDPDSVPAYVSGSNLKYAVSPENVKKLENDEAKTGQESTLRLLLGIRKWLEANGCKGYL